jgi:hypothetical protein
MSKLAAYYKDQKTEGVPLATALRNTPTNIMTTTCTVGDCFEAARVAGYEGILPTRKTKPGDGIECPECETNRTWESHTGPNFLFCRNCLEVYDLKKTTNVDTTSG